MLLMHGLSHGPALTRNTKERASVCQSDQVGLRPPRVTSHTILTRTIFSCMSFIPNCRAGFISSLNLLAERTPAPFYQSLLQSSCRAGLYDCTLCVCVFFPSILDIKFVGRTSRGHTGGRSHRIFNPPSFFCGACLDFCSEKDSAIPFPRRP